MKNEQSSHTIYCWAILLCGLLTSCFSCTPDVKVTDIRISQPSGTPDVNSKPVKVKGTIVFTGNFAKKYKLCLYKWIDGSFYWQKGSGNVLLVGSDWEGEVWPQEDGFTDEQRRDGSKIEGVITVVCEQNKEHPGYNNPNNEIKLELLEQSLPPDIGVNKSGIAEYRNLYPGLRRGN